MKFSPHIILIAFFIGLAVGVVLCDLISHAASDDYWLGYEDRQLHENYGKADPYAPTFQYNKNAEPRWYNGEKPC